MPDHKPPRLQGDERATLLALLQYHRESLVSKLSGLSESELRFSPVHSATSLLWLVKHLTTAEEIWMVQRFAGLASESFTLTVDDSDSSAAVVDRYRSQWARTASIVDVASLEDLTRSTGEESAVNLRWVLMHLLEETARHAGHADIIRELIDGSTGR